MASSGGNVEASVRQDECSSAQTPTSADGGQTLVLDPIVTCGRVNSIPLYT